MKGLINAGLPAILMVLSTIYGCTNSIDYEGEGDTNENVLVINATLDGMKIIMPSTRAVEDIKLSEKLFKIVGFQTYKDKTFDGEKATIKPNLYTDKYTTPKLDDKGRLITEKTWSAEEGRAITFFAFSDNTPAASASGITAHSDDNHMGYPWLDIKLKPAPYSATGVLEQGDIVAAQVMDEPNHIEFSALDLNFKHILSKVSFKAFSSTKAKINISELTYGMSKLYTSGRFTFNGVKTGTPGVFSALSDQNTTSSHRIYPDTDTKPVINATDGANTVTTNAIALGNALFVPQAVSDGSLSLTIKYSIELSPNNWSDEIAKTISLRAPLSGTFTSGSHYVYYIDFAADDIRISIEGIEDWDSSTRALPIVFGPRGDIMVEYSAEEPPFIANDGSRWILDRSGYNRHGLISGATSAITYNANTKIYEFKKAARDTYISIPDISDIEEVTTEVVASVPKDVTTSYFNTVFKFNCPDENEYTATLNGGNSSFYFISANIEMKKEMRDEMFESLSLWTFCRSGKFHIASRNSHIQVMSKLDNSSYNIGALNDGQLGYNFGGNIKYFRIVRKGTNLATIDKRSNELSIELKYPQNAIISNSCYGRPVARFKKAQAPFVDADGQRYWEDLSGWGCHLWISPSVVYKEGEGYYFNGNDAYMKFTKIPPQFDRDMTMYNQISPDNVSLSNRVLFHMANATTDSNSNSPLIQYAPWQMNNQNTLRGFSYGDQSIFDDFATAASTPKSYHVSMINNRTIGLHRYIPTADISNGGKMDTYSGAITKKKINHIYIGCKADQTLFYKGMIHDIILYNYALEYNGQAESEEAKVYRYERAWKGTEIK